jgi:hypothetical protein
MAQINPVSLPDYDKTRIIERPDGFFWLNQETSEEFGPFATLLQAIEDMEYNANADSGYEPVEPLAALEQELGLADWVDMETGELAEDTQIRIEDH